MVYFDLVLGPLLVSGIVAATCECGYQTNAGDVWQYSILSDFSNTSTSTFASSADWTIVDAVHESGTTNPYNLAYTSANVAVQDSTLQLTCSAYNMSSDMTIYAGEITTQRDDILYGSFRSNHRVQGGSGAVAALFFYADDDNEIDIEHLTDDPVTYVHFTNQPDETLTTSMPDGVERTSYATYRFDWHPSQTRFYVNDMLTTNFTADVPTVSGTIQLNSWANGGSFTGAQVPTTDSVMSVQWIRLYFNTSSSSSAASWASACEAAAVAICQVDSDEIALNSAAKSSAGKLAVAYFWLQWVVLSSLVYLV
ncbi:hypothetical protein N0V93_002131 [Gnomoniopsis smithogilvyi]|uniref:GH16 domain-containing protein n=1 Tax=Gnomoniopsis smithogilvyi TaxID=1191159 RepID=A0A9W8YUR1_9PEZI|nr:hypothetical protein N0V93_002131 [Gnomoniopsis smithogilvyi]